MPDHPVPQALARLIEHPVINTSAKLHGEVQSDPREIEKRFRGSVSIVIDGGIIAGEPSTVISLVDDKVAILREGKGPITALLQG